MHYEVLVIGGGPAGSASALLLAKAGWQVALVEKADFPRAKVCGEFMSATNASLLKHVEIDSFYYKNSGPQIRRVGLFAGQRMLSCPWPNDEIDNLSGGYAIGRDKLDLALLQNARQVGVDVFQPWTASKVIRESDLFSCEIHHKKLAKSITADLVIIAQGSWERSVMPFTSYKNHQSGDWLAFKAHFINSELASDLMPLFAFPGGYGGLVNTDQNRLSFSCCIRRDQLQRTRKVFPTLSAGEAVCEHIAAHCKGVKQALAKATCLGKWHSVGPLKPGIHQTYQHPGLFFVGNSAGEAHPIIAEGISMALQSAWLLFNALAPLHNVIHQKKVMYQAGKQYSRQWRQQFAGRIHAASLFAQLASRPRYFHGLLPLLNRFPSLVEWGIKLAGKVKPLPLK